MTRRGNLHNRQGTQVPIPQILLLMGLISRNRGSCCSLVHEMDKSGTEVPLGALSRNFKTAALYPAAAASGEGR